MLEIHTIPSSTPVLAIIRKRQDNREFNDGENIICVYYETTGDIDAGIKYNTQISTHQYSVDPRHCQIEINGVNYQIVDTKQMGRNTPGRVPFWQCLMTKHTR